MYGWSFSAISWAASRGCSFCGRRGKSTIWLIGTKPRMPQSTMRPPLLWSMTGASMIVARLEQLLHRAPLALEAGAAEREDDVALGRLRLEHVHEDDVADAELRLRLGVAAVELAVADDAFRLRADVDQDLVLVDADDRAFDDVAVLEALDVGVLLGEQLLHRRRLGAGAASRGRRAARPRARCRPRAARRPPRPPRLRCLDGLVRGCGGEPRRRRRPGLGGLDGPRRRRRPRPPGPRRPPRARRRRRPRRRSVHGLGGHGVRRLGRLDGCRGFGGLGLVGRGGLVGRRAIHRRGGDRLGCGGGARLGAGLGGGGLVGHGDGRDGLLGRRGIAGGCRLRRRRGPALLLVGQGDPVSFMDSALESRTAAEPRPGPSWRGRGIVGDLAGGPLLRADETGTLLFNCSCPDGPGESSTRVCVGTIAARARAARSRRRRRRVPRRPDGPVGEGASGRRCR